MGNLHLGCLATAMPGWENIDDAFHHVHSGHRLEPRYRAEAESRVREADRVLEPGGVLRLVVANLDALDSRPNGRLLMEGMT